MSDIWPDVEVLESSDKNVFKFVFKKDDAIAEAVLYKYPTFEDRTVMCVSVMTGCPVGCEFCGTGEFFGRNLKAAEIIDQVQIMSDKFDLRLNDSNKAQIMFMSMGEPLLNLRNVMSTIEVLHLAYPDAQLLISTIAPTVKDELFDEFLELAHDIPTIGLQFSIHESSDIKRDKLIPFKAKHSLDEITNMGTKFFLKTGRKPYFNYCVHPDNSSDMDVTALELQFPPAIWECTLSVICESDSNMAAAVDLHLGIIAEFSSKLIGRGFNTRIFNPAGQDDIGGGCGMLHQVQKWRKENPQHFRDSPGHKQRIIASSNCRSDI